MVGDWDKTVFKNNIIGHSALADFFGIPAVLTSSYQQGIFRKLRFFCRVVLRPSGSNGPLLKEITDMYPNAPLIKRQGEINAWDNPEFRAAVRATGKKQLIIGGILTEVCK